MIELSPPIMFEMCGGNILSLQEYMCRQDGIDTPTNIKIVLTKTLTKIFTNRGYFDKWSESMLTVFV